jgi:hypothetical protein
MSDDTPRRPSPTSRARRIGGRPVPRPDGGGQPDAAAGTSVPTVHAAQTAPPAPVSAPPPSYDAQPVADAPAPGRAGASRFPMQWLPAAVLGVAVVVLAVFLAVASHGVYWAKPGDSAGIRTVNQEKVLAAATKCFAQINSYDYRKLDGLLQKDLACTTGTFTSDLREAVQKEILKLAPQLHATQTAQINKAGIASVSPSGDQVVTLIYGQLAQSNTKTAKTSPRLDVVGAVVTVDDVHGQWLISKVDADTGSSLGS